MRRLAAAWLGAAFLAAIALVGCGGGGGDTVAQTTPDASAPAPAPAPSPVLGAPKVEVLAAVAPRSRVAADATGSIGVLSVILTGDTLTLTLQRYDRSGGPASSTVVGSYAGMTVPTGLVAGADGGFYVGMESAVFLPFGGSAGAMRVGGWIDLVKGPVVTRVADWKPLSALQVQRAPVSLTAGPGGALYFVDLIGGQLMRWPLSGEPQALGAVRVARSLGTEASEAYSNVKLAIDPSGQAYVLKDRLLFRMGNDAKLVLLAGRPRPPRSGEVEPIGDTVTSDGEGSSAGFALGSALACDAAGDVYVGDGASLRKVTPAGVVSTVRFTGAGLPEGNITSLTAGAPGQLYAVVGNQLVRITLR